VLVTVCFNDIPIDLAVNKQKKHFYFQQKKWRKATLKNLKKDF